MRDAGIDDCEYINKVVIKEADSIKLLPLPDVAQITAWKQHVRSKVVSASGRGDEAFSWILDAEDKDIDDSDLKPSRKFLTIDAKLHTAVKEIAKGRIGAVITSLV